MMTRHPANPALDAALTFDYDSTVPPELATDRRIDAIHTLLRGFS